jgi:hypothetical protein
LHIHGIKEAVMSQTNKPIRRLQRTPLQRGRYPARIIGIKSKPGAGAWSLTIHFRIMDGRQKDRTFRAGLDLFRHADCQRLRYLAAGCGFSGFNVLDENFEAFKGRAAKITIWRLDPGAGKGSPVAARWSCGGLQEPGEVPSIEVGENESRARIMLPRRSYVVQAVESKVITRKGEREEVLGLLFEVMNSAPIGYGGSRGWHIERFFRVMDEDEATRAEARREVSMIMRAAGIEDMEDSEELHDRPFKMHLWRMGFNCMQAVAERFSCEPLTDAEFYRHGLPKPISPEDGPQAA